MTESLLPKPANSSDEHPPLPIIVGFPRSGTTLLRLMLDSHSELAVTHEAGFIPMAANLSNPLSWCFYGRLKNILHDGSGNNNLRKEFQRTVKGMITWNDFHIPDEIFEPALEKIVPFTIADGVRTFFRLYASRFDKPRYGDKTPFYGPYLRKIEKILPEAYFIHIIRDGRDAALSGKGMPFVGDNLKAISKNWSRQIQNTRNQALACSHYLEIKYEDLILETTATLQKICRFISLGYEPRMEHFYAQARERMDELGSTYNRDGSVSVSKEARLFRHRLTSQPPEPTRLARWKTEMSKGDLAAFNDIAGNVLRESGYET